MPNIIFGGQSYTCANGSMLECLTAQGASIPSIPFLNLPDLHDEAVAGLLTTCLNR